MITSARILTLGAIFLVLRMSALADPNLTVSDGLGDSITIDARTGGIATTGSISTRAFTNYATGPGNSSVGFLGNIGDWSMQVDVGSTWGGPQYPTLDVNMAGKSGSGVLTVTWTDDTLALKAGQTIVSNLYSAFQSATLTAYQGATVIGNPITATPGSATHAVVGLTFDTSEIADQVAITGNGASISTDGYVTVPDRGQSAAMLVAALLLLGTLGVGAGMSESFTNRPEIGRLN